MNTARCPSCRSDVIIDDDAYEGDLVDCVNCGAQMELVALSPPQVNLIEDDLDIISDEDENTDYENSEELEDELLEEE